MDELGGPDVDTAGGLRGDEQLHLAAQLPGDDHLLLVAAGQGADRGVGRGRPYVELGDPLPGRLGDRGRTQGQPPGVRGAVVLVEDQVLGHGEGADEPVDRAVLRHVPDPGGQDLLGGPAGQVQPEQADHTAGDRPESHDRLDQLGLPVALDTGDPEHLTGAYLQHRLAGPGGRLVHPQPYGASDHQRGQLVLARVGPGGADDLPTAYHRDPVGDRLDLLELVGDEDDRLTGRLQRAHHVEQLVDLLRGQHGGRLVEDQQVDLADQGLDDLDPLLYADR